MVNFDFRDYIERKYKKIENFTEGLSPVMNHNDEWGYIDLTGKEVIPCQFSFARNFKEGFAPVMNKTQKWGYIDRTGNEVISCDYVAVSDFSSGLAAVQDSNGLWGYINKDGNMIIPCQFISASDFGYDFARIKDDKQKIKYIDKKGNLFGSYIWAENFYNGIAMIQDNDEKFYIIDQSFEVNRNFNELGINKFFRIGSVSDGMRIVQIGINKFGYLSYDLKPKVPVIYSSGRFFEDGIAVVEFGNDKIGFVNKEGAYTEFDKSQYKIIKDFHEGLANVQNAKNNLWGYINKEGKEVIPCQYKSSESFSNGLAQIVDLYDYLCFIDHNGEKQIIFPPFYCSNLNFGETKIKLRVKNEKELQEEKTRILTQIKMAVDNNGIEDASDVKKETGTQYQLKYHRNDEL